MEEELLLQKDKNKFVEWFKDKLKCLSDALKRLAGKAVAALPGIIGSVFGAVLNFWLKLLALQRLMFGHSLSLLLVQLARGYIFKLLEYTSESMTHLLFSSSSTFCSKLSQTCTSEAATFLYNIKGFL